MVASAMAVEVSSMVQIGGNVMGYDGSNFEMFKANAYDPSGDSDYLWKLSVANDKAGAEIWSWNVGGTSSNWGELELTDTSDWTTKYNLAGMLPGGVSVVDSVKLWFSPLDGLKFTVGNVGGQSIANPNFGWWAQTAQNYAYGYQVDYSIGSLAVSLAMEPGAGLSWIDTSKTGLDVIGGTWLSVKYGVEGIGDFQFVATKDGTIGAHGYSNWATSPLALGLAYAKMPYGQTGFYGDAFISFKKDGDKLAFQGVDSQIGGQFAMDSLLVQLTNLIQYRDAFKYGFELRCQYAMGAVTPYVQIDGYEIMNKSMDVQIGIDTSVAECGINVYLDVPLKFDDSYKFNFSIPVQFTVNL